MPCFIKYYRKLKQRSRKEAGVSADFPPDVIEEVDEALERFFRVKRHQELEEKLGEIFAGGDPRELAQLEALLDSLIQKALRKSGVRMKETERYLAYQYS